MDTEDPKPARIPVIGRMKLWELVFILASAGLAATGVFCLHALGPEIDKVDAPGSGGGAQMILALAFVYPAVLISGFVAVVGIVGFFVLVAYVVFRLMRRRFHEQRDSTP